MRVVSQSGIVDIPYEIAVLYLEEDGSQAYVMAKTSIQKFCLASYSDRNRAKLEMVRILDNYNQGAKTIQFRADGKFIPEKR